MSHTSWRSISRGRLQEDGHHCLQCPRITVGKTLVDGRLSGAYLHRRGTTAEKALGNEAEVALECFTLWSDVSGDSLTFRQVLRFPQAPSSWAYPRISTAKWWCPLHTKLQTVVAAHRMP